MTTRFTRTVPILRIFDVAKAREFYLDFLGCKVDWEHRYAPDLPLFMQVSLGEVILHLSEHHGDCSPGAKITIEMTGLAAYHADLLNIMQDSPFVNAGRLEVLGQPIDMGQVDVEAYIVAGITDHITPWKSCYPTARIYGPKSTFTLANAGHLQSIINLPGQAKSYFLTDKVGGTDADAWAAAATRVEGSWWPHWMAWMHVRSGERVPAPKKLGSRKHKPGAAAPGEYVLEA